jgi:hypothetical protein
LVIPLDGTATIGESVIRGGECALAESIGEVSFAGRSLIAQPCA